MLSDTVNAFFGDILYGDLILAGIILVLFAIIAKLFTYVVRNIGVKYAEKTKSELDEELLKLAVNPVGLLLFLVGMYFSFTTIIVLKPYAGLLTRLFSLLGIIVGAVIAVRVINMLMTWYAARVAAKTQTHRFDYTFLPIIKTVTTLVIYLIAAILILRGFNVEITPLVASLGIGGLAVALALQETLSNFFAGVYMVTGRALKTGDYIELESGIKGYVHRIGWRHSMIKTLPNNVVLVPNSKLAQYSITNYSYPSKETDIKIKVGVAYDSDLEKVEKVTVRIAKEIMQKVEGGIKEFEPVVRFEEFGNSNINFVVTLRIDEYVHKYLITHEFIKALHKEYKKEGIEIAFPCTNLYMRQESTEASERG